MDMAIVVVAAGAAAEVAVKLMIAGVTIDVITGASDSAAARNDATL